MSTQHTQGHGILREWIRDAKAIIEKAEYINDAR